MAMVREAGRAACRVRLEDACERLTFIGSEEGQRKACSHDEGNDPGHAVGDQQGTHGELPALNHAAQRPGQRRNEANVRGRRGSIGSRGRIAETGKVGAGHTYL